MKLLFVVKSLAFAGGAERVLADLTDGLARRGHEVIVATFDPPGLDPFYPFNPRLEMLSLGIGDIGRKSSAVDVLRRASAVRRLVLERRPDLVIGFMHSAYVPVAFGLIGIDIPTLGSEHIVYGHYSDLLVERVMFNLAASRLSALTGITPEMRDGFPGPVRRKMHVIPNPVRMNAGRSADPAGGKDKTILSVGRLDDQKDHATLISAFSAVSGAFPDWRLRIVGEGSWRGALEQQIQDAGLTDRVELPGVISEIGAEYAAAQVFAMSSLYESFGLATAEALSYGLPVVGFGTCPGTSELVTDEVNGVLVGEGDRVGNFAEGLRRLMESAELRVRLGSAGPRSVERFSVESVVAQWDDLMRRMAASPRRGSVACAG